MHVYHTARGKVPYIKMTARVMGQRQIDLWRAMMAYHGRRSHELAADILLEAIRAAEEDPEITDLARAIRRSTSRLQLVEGVPDDEAGTVHPLHGRDLAGPGAVPGQPASPGLPADGS
jgi:hypothetical protein